MRLRFFLPGSLLLAGLLTTGVPPAAATDGLPNRFALKTIQTPAALLGVAYSPDGLRVATCGLGRDVVVWDVASGQPALTLKGHTDDVVAVAFSPNGRYLASGGVDKALILWDAITGELLRRTTDHADYVRDVAFSPDSKKLASAGWDGQALVFDTFGGQRLATLRAGGAVAAANAAPAPAGAKAAKGRTGNVTSVAFSPDGRELLTASGDHCLRTWNTATWQLTATLAGHTDEVWDARYAPNGRYAVSGAWDNTARVWDLAQGQCARIVPAHTSDVWAAAFSPDGQLIATGGGDRRVNVWDAALGSLVYAVSGADHTAEVENLAFSPDGRTLASVSRDGSLRFWRVPTPDDRIRAYADHEIEKWATKGPYEKSEAYQRRLAQRFERLQELQAEGRERVLAGFGTTANWQSFALGTYNADTEAFSLTSGLWPGLFHVKVAPKEAARFRENFGTGTFGTPELVFEDGAIGLKEVVVAVPLGAQPHDFELTR